VLTRQIADLTGLWEVLIAGWRLAANEGVQVAKSFGTVARVWDWSYVNVIEEWTTRSWKVGEVHLEGNANAIGIGTCRDAANDVAAWIIWGEEGFGWKGGYVDLSWWVVLDGGSIAKVSSDWVFGGVLRSRKGDSEDDGDEV